MFLLFHIFALHSCNFRLYAQFNICSVRFGLVWLGMIRFGSVELHLCKACWNYTIFRKCHKITINFNVETFPFQQFIRWINTRNCVEGRKGAKISRSNCINTSRSHTIRDRMKNEWTNINAISALIFPFRCLFNERSMFSVVTLAFICTM